MAISLQTPVLYPVATYDPLDDKIFKFDYDDNQPFANRLVVIDRHTNVTVYDKKISSLTLMHLLPGFTCVSNHSYTAQVQVFDQNGNESLLSDPIVFWTFTTPTFKLNLTDGYVLRKSSTTLTIEYSQVDDEQLSNVQYMLYSANKSLIRSSDVFYGKEAIDNSYFNIYSLSNNTEYYLRAVGQTTHEFEVDTGFIRIDVTYLTTQKLIPLELINEYCDGYMQVKTNIIDIRYYFNHDGYSFDDDGHLNMYGRNGLNYWGMSVDGDWSLFVEAKEFPPSKLLMLGRNHVKVVKNSSLSKTYFDPVVTFEIVDIDAEWWVKATIHESGLQLSKPIPTEYLLGDDCGHHVTTNGGSIVMTDHKCEGILDFVVFELKKHGYWYELRCYFKEEYLEKGD